MALGIKICKVCGKEYEACHTLRPNLNNEFRYQDVACCPEHGAEYLRRILISRGQLPAEEVNVQEAPEEPTPKKRVRRKKKEAVQADDDKEMA